MPLSSTPASSILSAVPGGLPDRDDYPCFGRFAGSVAKINRSPLTRLYARNALWRRLHHKRWQYAALCTGQLFCGIAIVGIGWTNTAFAYAFDHRQRRIIASFLQDGLLERTIPHGAGLPPTALMLRE